MTDRYERIRAVLAECRDIAMEWTLRGRIPECGKFGEIAQSLDAVCAELAFLESAPVSVPRGWKLVPIEPTPEMLAANGTCKLAAGQQMLNDDARKTWRAMLSAAPQPPSAPAGDGCHCATCTCNPNMTPAVRFDLSPAQMEGAIREHLIRLGWTPPDEHALSQPAEIDALRAEVDALRKAVVRADLQIGDGHIEAARITLHDAMDAALSPPEQPAALSKENRND